MQSRLSHELTAEFFGTLVLILFGNGVVAMEVLFSKGGYTNITLAWGLAVTMGIYIAGKTTGAHLNPAVTLALAVFRGFSWAKVLPYILVQTAGAFVAAALVFWNYHPQFLTVDPTLERIDDDLPKQKEVYLYCTCIRDATSSRVARTLLEKGVRCKVIAGGLRAWKKAGLPMEPVPSGEIVPLPVFES